MSNIFNKINSESKDVIIKECLNLMNEEQRVSLYEKFNGGTFSTLEFKEWLYDIVDFNLDEVI